MATDDGPRKRARIYFAFRSPYSRLGLHIAARAGLADAPGVEVHPFTGPPDGVAFQDPVANKLKLAYYGEDAPRMTSRLGLEMRAPRPFEVDVSAANKAAVAAALDGVGLAFAIAVSDARWGEGRNVSEIDVLRAAAEAAGWRAARVDEAQADPRVAERLEASRTAIAKDRAFGVPFAVIETADGAMRRYWGHDRFDLFVEDYAAA
ncbi:MAG: DsbA family protein [Parvularculaceae bacterium]